MLLALENMLVYRPRHSSEDWWPPPNHRVEDVFLSLPTGPRIHAWWCPVADWTPPQGALIYCHGNGGNLSQRGQGISHWQRELGLSVLIFDYPGYGKSEGKPSEAGCYAAADAAYDWLVKQRQVSAEAIVLYGGSLGGGVAVDVASRRSHRALVLVNTFTDMPSVAQRLYPWLPVRWVMRNRYDNVNKIRRCRRPVFIAHGDADRMVPFALGRQLFEAANEPKRFVTLSGCDHHDSPTPEFWRELRDFLGEQGVRKEGSGVRGQG